MNVYEDILSHIRIYPNGNGTRFYYPGLYIELRRLIDDQTRDRFTVESFVRGLREYPNGPLNPRINTEIKRLIESSRHDLVQFMKDYPNNPHMYPEIVAEVKRIVGVARESEWRDILNYLKDYPNTPVGEHPLISAEIKRLISDATRAERTANEALKNTLASEKLLTDSLRKRAARDAEELKDGGGIIKDLRAQQLEFVNEGNRLRAALCEKRFLDEQTLRQTGGVLDQLDQRFPWLRDVNFPCASYMGRGNFYETRRELRKLYEWAKCQASFKAYVEVHPYSDSIPSSPTTTVKCADCQKLFPTLAFPPYCVTCLKVRSKHLIFAWHPPTCVKCGHRVNKSGPLICEECAKGNYNCDGCGKHTFWFAKRPATLLCFDCGRKSPFEQLAARVARLDMTPVLNDLVKEARDQVLNDLVKEARYLTAEKDSKAKDRS